FVRRGVTMINLDDLPMRVAIGQFSELTDEQLAFAKQVGADDVLLNTPCLPGDERWEYEDLLAWRQRAEEHGLRLITLENVPVHFYDQIMIGADGRERQLENMIATVRNMGRAGIPARCTASTSATAAGPRCAAARGCWRRSATSASAGGCSTSTCATWLERPRRSSRKCSWAMAMWTRCRR